MSVFRTGRDLPDILALRDVSAWSGINRACSSSGSQQAVNPASGRNATGQPLLVRPIWLRWRPSPKKLKSVPDDRAEARLHITDMPAHVRRTY